MMKDELFNLVLYVDKNVYTSDETILCYATLEYIGEDDSITIYHSDPLIGFALKDDKYFDGGYFSNDVLITTTLQKGSAMKYEFRKSGGWSADDPRAEFYTKYYDDPDLVLPAGRYELSVTLDCSLDTEDILGSGYKRTVSTFIEVAE